MVIYDNLKVKIINMGFFTSSSYPVVTINFLNRQYTCGFPIDLADALTQYHLATMPIRSDEMIKTLSSDEQKELLYLGQRIIDVASEIDEKQDDQALPAAARSRIFFLVDYCGFYDVSRVRYSFLIRLVILPSSIDVNSMQVFQ